MKNMGIPKQSQPHYIQPDAKPWQRTRQSRRQFVQQLAFGASALLASRAVANPFVTGLNNPLRRGHILPANNVLPTSTDTDITPAARTASGCIAASISTRLFASSNAGQNSERNRLSLQRLTCAGFALENPEIVARQYLRFAGTDAQRASDLQNIATGAIPAPKLLLGVRGGYGAMRLLPLVDWSSLSRVMQQQGTIMAGFSDVTAVQCALLAKGGMSSLAAPMLYSEFGKDSPDQVSCQHFVAALTNPQLSIEVTGSSTALNNSLTGTIWGGNLSVVSALAGSDYLPQPKGGIVFLEDTGEQPYRIERMLYSLYLAGAFKSQQAIVLGAFSGTGQDSYDGRYDINAVIEQLQRITGLPVLTGVPFGHVAKKHSFPLGARCSVSPTNQGYRLSFSDYPVLAADAIYPEGLWQSY